MQLSRFALLAASLLALLFSLATREALAAPCCSGSSSIPGVITGDDRAQLSAAFSSATVIGDAPAEGLPVFRSASESETTRLYRIDGALLFSDRFQAGASVSLLDRNFSAGGVHASARRLGDLELSGAYEFLPEWSYSAWKPRGHVFIGATAPTGRSIYESTSAGLVDATGKGFYRIQSGAILIKRLTLWDFSLIGELHRSLPRTFAGTPASPDPLRVDAGFGGSLSFGAGVSPGGGDFRIGLRVQPNWNQGKAIESAQGKSQGAGIQTVDTSLETTYLFSEGAGGSWTGFGTYTDQTLLGPAKNAVLSRSLALGVQHRWDR